MVLGEILQTSGLLTISNRFQNTRITREMVLSSSKILISLRLSATPMSTTFMMTGTTVIMKLWVTMVEPSHSTSTSKPHKKSLFQLISTITECIPQTVNAPTQLEP